MPKFLAIIMEMVATSTLCLNVYSSLVLSALISTAKASLWSMAWIKSFVIFAEVFVNSGESELLYKYWIPSDTRFLTLSDK